MIPMIWLINIWLVNWWFMDGWPGWKLRMRTHEEVKAAEAEDEARTVWRSEMTAGLVIGILAGIVFYIALIWLLPILSANFTLVD